MEQLRQLDTQQRLGDSPLLPQGLQAGDVLQIFHEATVPSIEDFRVKLEKN